MQSKVLLYVCLIILSIVFIIIDKFILISHYGWLETIVFLSCIVLLIFSCIRLSQLLNLSKVLRIGLEIITILFILWFAMLSIDYKRHRNLYQPIFTSSKKLLTTNGIDVHNGLCYSIVQDYDINTKTGKTYKSKSAFYFFKIKINEVNI